MSQAAWESAVDNAVEIALQCGVTLQEFTDYANDEAEMQMRRGEQDKAGRDA